MRILVQRDPSDEVCTLGDMTIVGDSYHAFTLEPPVRAEKIMGHTAIWAGVYKVTLRPSPKFGMRLMPHIENVPEFSEIMIHPGNTVGDTLGCILVGETMDRDEILKSREAFNILLTKIKLAYAVDPDSISIEVRNYVSA